MSLPSNRRDWSPLAVAAFQLGRASASENAEPTDDNVRVALAVLRSSPIAGPPGLLESDTLRDDVRRLINDTLAPIPDEYELPSLPIATADAGAFLQAYREALAAESESTRAQARQWAQAIVMLARAALVAA